MFYFVLNDYLVKKEMRLTSQKKNRIYFSKCIESNNDRIKYIFDYKFLTKVIYGRLSIFKYYTHYLSFDVCDIMQNEMTDYI